MRRCIACGFHRYESEQECVACGGDLVELEGGAQAEADRSVSEPVAQDAPIAVEEAPARRSRVRQIRVLSEPFREPSQPLRVVGHLTKLDRNVLASVLVTLFMMVAGLVFLAERRRNTQEVGTNSPSTSEEPAVESPRVEPMPEGMVAIPGGVYRIGSDLGDEYERPSHAVTLDAFYIDAREVSCAEYLEFVIETNQAPPAYWRHGRYAPGADLEPVRGVSWYDAVAYARWAKKRLPTEAEWEAAARGLDGRLYPWGDRWEPGRANAEPADLATARVRDVGTGADASPFGALDMSGNVWEWTASDLAAYQGGRLPARIPLGRTLKVIRGGCYLLDRTQVTTTRRRGWPARDAEYDQTGFRCAISAREWKRNGSAVASSTLRSVPEGRP